MKAQLGARINAERTNPAYDYPPYDPEEEKRLINKAAKIADMYDDEGCGDGASSGSVVIQ